MFGDENPIITPATSLGSTVFYPTTDIRHRWNLRPETGRVRENGGDLWSRCSQTGGL